MIILPRCHVLRNKMKFFNFVISVLSSINSCYSFETYSYDKQENVGSLMFEKMEHRKFRVTATSISSLIAARNIGENKRRNGREV